MKSQPKENYDAVVVGGGFFGCCLALFLASVSEKVALVEAGPDFLNRASRVNQARVHSGFHYPRSFVTAARSSILQKRFVEDFPEAVVDDFQMLYAIARRRSKVTARRFERMFLDMQASIRRAGPAASAQFSPDLIEGVFECEEFSFNWRVLKDQLLDRLDATGVDVLTSSPVTHFESQDEGCRVHLHEGMSLQAGSVFNVTYCNINTLLLASGFEPLPLKHELAELVLIKPPEELSQLAFTIMDGPFWSAMPFPDKQLYSLSHVRYTPHAGWMDKKNVAPDVILRSHPKETRWQHMIKDAARYVPSLGQSIYDSSLFEVKTVLTKNERDDGRPILCHRHADAPNLYSIMGAKIDNIYDLFDALPLLSPKWQQANSSLLFSK